MTASKNWPLRAWLVGIGIIIAGWAPGLSAQWKIMPIGDSITEGVGSSGTGYRSFLYDKLQGVNFSLVGPNGAAPYNGHFTRGAKIEEFYTGGYGTGTRDIASSMSTYQPDILLIHLGTNNMNNDTAAPYSENAGISMLPTSSGKLAQLLAYASQWANGTRGDFVKRIIICKIIPRLVNGSPDPKIADFNAEVDRMFFENAPGIVVSKITLADMNSVVLISDLGDGTHPTDIGYNRMATEFNRIIRGVVAGDRSAPASISWLGADAISGSTASLKWQSTGDDGTNGQANLYEMRYSTFGLDVANFNQGILVSLPRPQSSGNIEATTVSGLVPGISYFFGIRAYDEMNNRGPVSIGPSVDMADTASTEYCDDFDDPLAADWDLNPAYRIDVTRGELVNSSTSPGWQYLAAFKAARYAPAVRGVRAAMQWSELADGAGLNASGLAMMLNSASSQASGYLVRVRDRVVYLNEIVNGSVPTGSLATAGFPSTAPDPKPGDILEVRYNPATTGHAFNVYLNNLFLNTVSDAAKRQGNFGQLYSGIVLYGGLNNPVDNFCLEVPPLSPDSMYASAGENKHGTVTQRLAEPLAVRVVDANGVPVSDVQVQFSVISGQAALSTDSLDVNFNGNIWIEAEAGDIGAPYVSGGSAEASGNEYIYAPYLPANNRVGLATYQIYIPKAGSYRLWLRGYAPDGLQNSCFYTFGTSDTVTFSFSTFASWTWESPKGSYSLPKGFVQLTIKNREAGLQLDKLLLTSNAGFNPAGTGSKTQRFSNITDVSGSAYTFISFGSAAGQVVVQASAPSVPNGSTLDFNLYADALPPLALQYASETILTGVAGQPLEKEFAVLLKDTYNNFCVGVPVEFEVTEGDGNFSRQSTIRVSSNSEGVASARFTLGYVTTNIITASLPDHPALAPITFQAIAGEGIPVSISIISGDAQADTVGQTLAEPLVVQVLDERSRPVLSYPVTFKIIRGSGLLNNSSAAVTDSTDSNGKAGVTWTLGDSAGTGNNSVRIDAPLTGAPILFTAAALPEAPTLMTILSGDNQTGYAGEELAAPLVVKISDRFGNGRADQRVIFSVVTGSGTFSGAAMDTVMTDEAGQASVIFKATSRTGLHQIQAQAAPGSGIQYKIFNLTIQPPRATILVPLSGNGQEEIILKTLPKPFLVRVTNPFGDPVPNTTVRFKIAGGGGTFGGRDSVDVISNTTGLAEATLTLGTLAGEGQQRVRVTAPGLAIEPIEFTATAVAGAAASIQPVSDVVFREEAESSVTLTVVVKDAYGNTKSGHPVAFAVSQGNGVLSATSVKSNGGGLASVQYRMGTSSAVPNIISVTSSFAGSPDQLTGSPITFIGTVLAGEPRQLIQLTAASGLGAQINSTLPEPFRVQVSDIHGNPCPQSLIITFRIVSGEGTFGENSTEEERVTDANGQAFALLRVGDIAGVNNNIVEVTVNERPQILPVRFTVSTYPGDPDLLDYEGQSSWSGRVQDEYTAKVVVKDIKGNLIQGQPVLFSVVRGGGSIRSASSTTARDTMTIQTNNVGVAAAFWRVGSRPDTNIVRASSAFQKSPLRGSPLQFTAAAAAEDPVTLLRVSAERDTGVVHQPLARPIRVRVVDGLQNPVPNHPVLFTVKYPVGSGLQGKLFTAGLADTAASKSIMTDAEGYAAAYLLLSSQLGLNHVNVESRFNKNHLSGSPMDFYITGTPSPAKSLLLLSGATVSAPAGSAVTVRVRANDGLGQPVGNHPVQFTVTDSYSSVGSPGLRWTSVNTSPATGEAAVTWLLGGKTGSRVNTLEINAGGLTGSPVTVSADVIAGAPYPPACRLTATDSVIADNIATSRLTVTLKDSFNNAIAGKRILFSSPDQGLIFIQPDQATNALGQATGTARSNRSGLKRIGARLEESGVEIASAQVTFLAGSPSQMTAYSSSAITVNAGSLARDSLAVLVTDGLNNPVADTPVTFTVINGGGYLLDSRLTAFTARSNQLGVASARFVAGIKPGEATVVRAASSHPRLTNIQINFVITVVPGLPALVQKYAGDGQTGQAGSELPLPLQVRIIDKAGEPVANVAVRFTAQDSGAAVNPAEPVLTDYLGLADVRYRLGYRAGEPPQIIDAQISGSTLTASFIAYATGQGARQLKVVEGEHQDGVAGKPTPLPIQVAIVDDFGNGVANAPVNFRLADNNGGSQVIIDSTRTDLSGIASLQPTLPTLVGEYIYIATSPLLPGQTAAFYCTVGPDAAYRLSKYAHDYQSMTAGRELLFPVIVRVTDQYNNPVPEVSIQFTTMPNSDNGEPLAPSVSSDGSGLAACRWRLSTQPKTNMLMANRFGLRDSPVWFTASGLLNQFPEFTELPASPLRIEYNRSFSMVINATDGDGDALRYSLKMDPPVANDTFDSTGSRTFTWKPTVRQKGDYQLHLRVEDGRGGFDIDSLLVSVVGDSAPVFTSTYPGERQVIIASPASQLFTCAAIDYDNDPIVFSWFVDGVKKAAGPRFEFRSAEHSKGAHYIWVTASDGIKEVSSELWEITVLTSVELSSFSASAEPWKGVEVSWSTSHEANNLGFELLRSTAGSGKYIRLTSRLIASREDGRYVYQDSSAVAGERYFYMLEDLDRSGARTLHGPVEVMLQLPATHALEQNFPNPFNPETAVRFRLPRGERVQLIVFNPLGQQVRTLIDGRLEAGYHAVKWDGRDEMGEKVSSGVYYYRLVTPGYQAVKKMALVK